MKLTFMKRGAKVTIEIKDYTEASKIIYHLLKLGYKVQQPIDSSNREKTIARLVNQGYLPLSETFMVHMNVPHDIVYVDKDGKARIRLNGIKLYDVAEGRIKSSRLTRWLAERACEILSYVNSQEDMLSLYLYYNMI